MKSGIWFDNGLLCEETLSDETMQVANLIHLTSAIQENLTLLRDIRANIISALNEGKIPDEDLAQADVLISGIKKLAATAKSACASITDPFLKKDTQTFVNETEKLLDTISPSFSQASLKWLVPQLKSKIAFEAESNHFKGPGNDGKRAVLRQPMKH